VATAKWHGLSKSSTPHQRRTQGEGEGMSELRQAKGVVIRPNGTHEERLFKQLSDYQTAVQGVIDAVRLYDYNGREVGCAYVDDEGLLKGSSMNPLGSAISFLFGNTPHLVGNIVIVGRADDEGYDTDIPDYLLTLIKNISAKEELVA